MNPSIDSPGSGAGISPEMISTVSRKAKSEFLQQYAASLGKDSVESVTEAFDILEKYRRGFALTNTERQIISQVKLIASVSEIRGILVEELQRRRPANRLGRRAKLARQRKLVAAYVKPKARDIYLDAVRLKTTVIELAAQRAKESMEAAEAEAGQV